MAEQSLEDNKHSDDGEPAVQNCEESTARLFLPDRLKNVSGYKCLNILVFHILHTLSSDFCVNIIHYSFTAAFRKEVLLSLNENSR